MNKVQLGRSAVLRLFVLAILVSALAGVAGATTYQVGPGRTYTKPQDVAGLLKPGDVVEVDGNATYPGDLQFTKPGTAANPITIRGIAVNGKKPLITGGTNTVYFRTDTIGQGADHYVMDGFEITGGSYRCVFHQSNDVTLRNLTVHGCPLHGILGADWGAGSLTVEYTEVYGSGSSDRYHQIYASTDEDNYPNAVFRLQHSWIHDATGGNNVKSRAARNEIYYNRIEGAYYHELELNGSECCAESLVREDSDVVGNLFIRKGSNANFYVVRFGGDGTGQSWGRYRFVNNTVVSGSSSVFRLFDGLESLEAHNNVFYRSGGAVSLVRTVEAVWSHGQQIVGSNNWLLSGATGVTGTWTGTITGTSPGFTNAAGGDYSPTSTSPLIDAGTASPTGPSGFPFANPLFPPAYEPPGIPGVFGSPNPRPADGVVDIGAYEWGTGGAPQLSVSDVSVSEGNSGTTNATFTVTLSPASTGTVTVNYATANGTATAGSDYTAASGTLTFGAGQNSKTVAVAVTGDTVIEPNESFYLALSGASGATVARPQAVGTIVNDDTASTITMSINDVSVAEGNTGTKSAVFTVSLSGSSSQAVTVSYATANGTATAGSDYVAAVGSLNFPAGTTTQTIAVVVNGDTTVEPNETFFVNLSNPVGAAIADGQGQGTITNDDTATTPTLSINDVSVVEGNSATTTARFTVTLSATSTSTVTVSYATGNATATAGSDYVSKSGTLTFAAGTTSQFVDVVVNGDTTVESNETFVVNLSSPVGATIARAQAVGTITNDDAATPPPTGAQAVVWTSLVGATASGNSLTKTAGTGWGNAGAISTQQIASGDGYVEFTASEATTYRMLGLSNGNTNSNWDDIDFSLYEYAGQLQVYEAGTARGTFGTYLPGDVLRVAVVGGVVKYSKNGTVLYTSPKAPVYPLLVDTALYSTNATLNNAMISSGSTLPTLSINDVSVAEGNSATTTAHFTVTLSAASASTVTVSYATGNATATAGSDYVSKSGTLTFAAGTTSQFVDVVVNGDTTVESNETFVVNLSSAVGAAIARVQAVGTIMNDDASTPPPTGTQPVAWTSVVGATPIANSLMKTAATGWGNAGAISTQQVASGDGYVEFTASEATTYRMLGLSNGNTNSNWDDIDFALYQYAGQLQVYEAGTARGTCGTYAPGDVLRVAVVGGVVKYSKNGTVLYTSPKAPVYPLLVDTALYSTSATLNNAMISSGSALPTLSINDVSVAEGNSGTTSAHFTVTLSAASTSPVTVNYATADATATAGSDYVSKSGTLTFAAGTTSQFVDVVVNGDTTVESNETFVVSLSSPVGATVADGQGQATITNDDTATTPTLSINDVSIAEGNSATTTAHFTVTLSAASTSTVTVSYATANGTATAGSDYVSKSGTLTFTAGTTSQFVDVVVNGDTTVESNETFVVSLSSPVGATVADGQGQATIVNDDTATTPTLSINDVSVAEGNSATTTAHFTVTLSAASTSPVTVSYATANGTATAGSDYVTKSGTLTFAAGTTSQFVDVVVNGDTTVESNETFVVNLSSPVGATVADGQGQATIVNDDTAAAITMSINDVSVVEGNSATTTARFTVTLSATSTSPVTVSYATANGTATAGSDYVSKSGTLTFAAGTTSQFVDVVVNGDTTVESNETFVVNLSSPVGATMARAQAVGTITNDDSSTPPPTSGTGFVTRPFLFQADRARLLASIAANDPEAIGTSSNDAGVPIAFISMCKSVYATRKNGQNSDNSDIDTWQFALAGWLTNDTAMMDMARDEAMAIVAASPGGVSGTSDPFQHSEEGILNVAGVADLAYSRFSASQLAQVATWVNGTLNNWNKQNLSYWPFDEPRNNYWQNGFLAFSVAGIATEGFNSQAAQWRTQTETMAGKFRTAASSPQWNGPMQTEGHYYSTYVQHAIWAMQFYDHVMGTNLLGASGLSPAQQLEMVMFETKPSLLEFFEIGSEPATSTAPFHATTLSYWHMLINAVPSSPQAQYAKSILQTAMADGGNFWPRSSKGFANFYWNIRSVAAAPLANKPERLFVAPTPGAGLIGVRSSAGFTTGARAAVMFSNYFDTNAAFSHANPDAPGFQWASGKNWLVTDPEYYNSGSGILAEAGSAYLSDISNIVTLAGQKASESGKFPAIRFAEDRRTDSVPHFYTQIDAQPYWTSASVYRRDYVWLDDLRVVAVFDHIVSSAAKTWRLHVPASPTVNGKTATYSIGGETVTLRDVYSSSGAALSQQNLNGSVTTQNVWRITQSDSANDYRSLKILDVGARVTSTTLTTASGSFTVKIQISGGAAVSVTFNDDGSHAVVTTAP